jgi:cell division protein ZapA (FtsZ GTPase activity inhibitor)
MSDEYEVHGPHDHAIEHAGSHGGDTNASRLAVMTAILASVGAIAAYQSGANENQALFYKNEAAIVKTDAANQWAYYQAKGEKQNLAELGAALSDPASAAHAKFVSDIARYKADKEPIRQKAEALEEQVKKDNEVSEALQHQHHRWAQATTLIQISIALAAITLLTKKSWLQKLTIGAAVISIGLFITAVMGL